MLIITGRVSSLYIGAGAVAERFAQVVESRRNESAFERQIEKERRQAERDRLHAEEEPLLDFFDQVEILFQVAMKAAGWYQHHRQCRRKRKITMGKRKQIPSFGFVPGPEMEAAIARRLFAEDHGTLVDTHGAGIARNAENSLISRITGDPRQQEAFARKLALLKIDLAGPNPAAIAKLLARCVTLCWLDAYYMDMLSFLGRGQREARRKGKQTVVAPSRFKSRGGRYSS